MSILAVGTEVVEGQIPDRNSAWIADQCARLGFAIISHRCVPDDRKAIRAAIELLSAESGTLFVTGGLGPTSDDFTREVIADAFSAPLEYSEAAFVEVRDKLAARGIQARDIQKQQCWFPRGARVLANSVGTANGFCVQRDDVKLYALPGPPIEIAAVFDGGVRAELAAIVPEAERVDLKIWRCLGRGESDIAEITERALGGSGLTVGYRAHQPYVEVKLWVPRAYREDKQKWIDRLEADLAPWIVNRDDDDVFDLFLARAHERHQEVVIIDAASGGVLGERAVERIRKNKMWGALPKIRVETFFSSSDVVPSFTSDNKICLSIEVRADGSGWTAMITAPARGLHSACSTTCNIDPPYVYALTSERARRFICEKSLQVAAEALRS